jgi:nucleoside-diphosphate-sugar epimerase
MDDPMQREPDIKAAHKIIGWAPKTKRYIGLEKTVAYFSKSKVID